MRHYMKLQTEPFEAVANGTKTIELRLDDEKRRKVSVGDEIEFTEYPDGRRKILTAVVALHRFGSFEELYRSLPLEKCGYAGSEIDGASPDDMLAYYSAEEQERYGVVGMEIKLSE